MHYKLIAKMSLAVLFFSIGAFFSTGAIAQETTPSNNSESLERIEQKLDRLTQTADKQDKAYLDQPLGDRTQGIEFNFFRLLLVGEGETALSGTYSRFNTKNNTELAFPVMLSRGEHSTRLSQVESLTTFTADAHYRKYLGERLNGFYLSGFARMAYLSGVVDDGQDSYFMSSRDIPTNKDSELKLGVGFGFGYRIISTNGIYWGTSLSVGRYLVGKSDNFLESDGLSADIDDSEIIVDVELLKFGYAF